MAVILALAGVGFVLMLTEMFLPGGVLGALGGLLLLGAVIAGYIQLGPLGGTAVLCAISIVCIVGFCVWMAVFPRTAVGRRLILAKSLGAGSDLPPFLGLIGREGAAQTPLRPSGKALIDGARVDVVAEGDFISPGEPVVVVAAEGARVVVRKKVGAAPMPG